MQLPTFISAITAFINATTGFYQCNYWILPMQLPTFINALTAFTNALTGFYQCTFNCVLF
jgi:hypothetical protein